LTVVDRGKKGVRETIGIVVLSIIGTFRGRTVGPFSEGLKTC